MAWLRQLLTGLHIYYVIEERPLSSISRPCGPVEACLACAGCVHEQSRPTSAKFSQPIRRTQGTPLRVIAAWNLAAYDIIDTTHRNGIIQIFQEGTYYMALTIGIIGLPQSGKTTLFNALTKANAPVSGYATSTVQANVAVVQVPDARLDPLAEIFHPKKTTYTTVEFVDVAGMGQGAQAGKEKREGLSAEFLGHIRNADALAIVLRTFANDNVPHIYNSIDPNRDLESLDAELALTDLATVERRIERTTRAAKSGDKKYQHELDVLRRLQDALNELKPVSQLDLLAQDHAVLDELFLLTMKPRMYVLNVSEDVLGAANDLLNRIAAGEDVDVNTLEGELIGIAAVAKRGKAERAEVVAVSARLEAELTELPEEDAHEYLESLGLPQLGTDRVIQVGYRLLNLIT